MAINAYPMEREYLRVVNSAGSALANRNYPIVTTAGSTAFDCADFERIEIDLLNGALADTITYQVYQVPAANSLSSAKVLTGGSVACATAHKPAKISFLTNKLDINNDFRYVYVAVTGVSGTDHATIVMRGINPGSAPTDPTVIGQTGTYSVVGTDLIIVP